MAGRRATGTVEHEDQPEPEVEHEDQPEPEVEAEVQPEPEVLVVLVPFAYATTLKHEARMLVKGTVVDPSGYTAQSISHLREIGFVGVES